LVPDILHTPKYSPPKDEASARFLLLQSDAEENEVGPIRILETTVVAATGLLLYK